MSEMITAKQVAGALRWRLSNSNGEIGDLDVAYNAWAEDEESPSFDLGVSYFNLGTRVGGDARFKVTVTPFVDDEDQGDGQGS